MPEEITKSEQSPEQEDLNVLMARRREELEQLKKMGVNPYPYFYECNAFSKEIIGSFADGAEQRIASIAGRIMSIRRMGKASFCHVQDGHGKIQVYLRKDDIGTAYDAFKLMDIGDIVGITGFIFRTKMGEISLHAQQLELLSKSLRPLPVVKEKINEKGEKTVYDPLSDKEIRYRQRYIDLIVNPDVRAVFVKRAKIISSMRRYFDDRGFLEVETPVLQPIYGGASARPFKTHHNALDFDFFLRIADELYLKRLIVGGYDGVYEISKDFRNEGMDRSHSPEFTMLEIYVAYKDYTWMMSMVEDLVSMAAIAANGSSKATVGDKIIDFTPPWRRISMFDAIKEFTGKDLSGKSEIDLRSAAQELHIDIGPKVGVGAIIDEIFGAKVEPFLIQPTFIIDYPLEMSPLAKKHRTKQGLVERFEAIVNGKELCNAFTELNDPLDQRARFEEQMKLRERGDEEAQVLDEDYLRALEYGMPPAAGLGIGIDRLTILLTNQESIRDVVLFPQMKPEMRE